VKEKDNLENPRVNKIDLQEIEWDDADWIHLVQDKYNAGLLWTCQCNTGSHKKGNFLTTLGSITFPSDTVLHGVGGTSSVTNPNNSMGIY
jgi:hypothetical protein